MHKLPATGGRPNRSGAPVPHVSAVILAPNEDVEITVTDTGLVSRPSCCRSASTDSGRVTIPAVTLAGYGRHEDRLKALLAGTTCTCQSRSTPPSWARS